MPGYAQGPMEGRSEQRVKRWGVLPDLHKYVLDNFFGLADVAKNTDGQRKERLGGQVVELRKGLRVLRRNAKQQLRLRLFCRLLIHHTLDNRSATIRWKRMGTAQHAVSSASPPALNWTVKTCIYQGIRSATGFGCINRMVTAVAPEDTPEQHGELMRPSIVGDDVRSLIILRQIGNQ